MLDAKMLQRLDELKKNFSWRKREEIENLSSSHVLINGKSYLSFATNNYLGLANHPEVVTACQNALKKYGLGSGSAYLISGYTFAHRELEEKLADFLKYPRVLLFSSGYLANTGIISALFSKQSYIFADKLIHASLLDGCLKSGSHFKRYPHCSIQHLEKFIQHAPSHSKLIVTESVYGMDGTLAPLDKIALIAKKYNATLLVDDAHGIGILGKHGRGALEHYNLSAMDIPLLVGTFGKAFGSYGAFVASHETTIESLVQSTRTYLYTTSLPPAIAAGSLASLQVIQKEGWRREKLFALIEYFKRCVKHLELPFLISDSPIQPIVVGTSQKALDISCKLLNKGIFVKAIRPPTVPKLGARIRISLTSEHSKEQIDYLLENLAYEIKI